jgi:Tfp pilus assembly protein PilV
MNHTEKSEAGFSLVETIVAVGLLTVAVLGMAGVFVQGMQKAYSSPDELLASQKASEAIESVISARDTHTLAWAQLRNVSDGGIFLNGQQPLYTQGVDGIVDTADDGGAAHEIQSVVFPGPDQQMHTADDKTYTLDKFQRQIVISDINDDLRSITVTITYKSGASTRTYTLTAYMSTFA